MLNYNYNKRFNLENIKSNIFHFKNKLEFQEEFDFGNTKDILGKGAFGLVKKCLSKKD